MNHIRTKKMKSRRSLIHAFVWLVLVALCLPPAQAAARRVRINLGTLAPRGSLYHQALQSMGEEWRKASDGQVRLVVYPDGVQGGEADMVRLMRIGTLQAGLFTAVGLTDIEPAVSGLQTLPMMFRSLEEFAYVNEKLRPQLEKRLADRGFMVLFWLDAGWLRYFSKEPMLMPADMKRMKTFVWAGNVAQVDMMKQAGFNPVPLETGEILGGLQTGLINVVSLPPIYALASQVDLRAPHMLEINWAVLVGAAVIKKDTWEEIPEDARTLFMETAAKTGQALQANSRNENEEAIAAMKNRGLTVHPMSEEMDTAWRKAAESFYPSIRGTLVPADIFDDVQRIIKEYRSGAAPRP